MTLNILQANMKANLAVHFLPWYISGSALPVSGNAKSPMWLLRLLQCPRPAGKCSMRSTMTSPARSSRLPASNYGEAEHWDYPKDKGDCEDLVLLKKRELGTAGFAPSTLLITVVRDGHGQGHGVLSIRTDDRDLVMVTATTACCAGMRPNTSSSSDSRRKTLSNG